MDKSTAKQFWFEIQSMDRERYRKKRLELAESLDGELFYRISYWPLYMKQIFWKKPLTDRNVFKLYLFLYGNGCIPEIIHLWTLSSLRWENEEKATKRINQLHWIDSQIDNKKSLWF